MDENTTDALNNLISSIKEKMNESNTNVSNTLNEEKEDNNNNNTNNTNTFNNSENSTSFDPDLFLKIQKIMGAMNGNNDKKNLLLSLKPFLRQTRQNKINEYINILNIISALDSFKKGRD